MRFKLVRMLETIFVIDSSKKETAILKVHDNNQAKLVESKSIELDKLEKVLFDNGYIMTA